MRGGGGITQLVERRTSILLTQVRFPGAARIFSSQRQLLVQAPRCIHTSPCAIACINICAHVKHPVVHVRVRWIMETLNYRNTKTSNMHRRVDSATLSQLAFSGESNPNCLCENPQWNIQFVRSGTISILLQCLLQSLVSASRILIQNRGGLAHQLKCTTFCSAIRQ